MSHLDRVGNVLVWLVLVLARLIAQPFSCAVQRAKRQKGLGYFVWQAILWLWPVWE